MEKTNAKQLPSRELKVIIGKNPYSIKLPNNGQLIDIEVNKLTVTNGMHKDLVYGSAASREAYLAVEAGCTFTILIPDLATDLNVKTLFNLDMLQSKSVTKAYQKYYDWMEEWRAALNEEEAAEK
jgi:hypothetical protein